MVANNALLNNNIATKGSWAKLKPTYFGQDNYNKREVNEQQNKNIR